MLIPVWKGVYFKRKAFALISDVVSFVKNVEKYVMCIQSALSLHTVCIQKCLHVDSGQSMWSIYVNPCHAE